MRILLVGEYSNLHNSLKAGLLANGHEVTLISTGDAFKKLPSDVLIKAKRIEGSRLLQTLRKGIFELTKFDLATLEIGYRVLDWLVDQTRFDVIQLINEYPFKTPYFIEKRIVKRLRQLTTKLVILACGDDYIYLNNIDKLAHHPILQHPDIDFPYSEKYLTATHKKYHEFVFELKDLVISTDLDYHPIYKGRTDYYGLIPNPVNLNNFSRNQPEKQNRIVIFHGVNRSNYYKKGNYYFDSTLCIIRKKFSDRIKIICVTSLPYAQYLESYRKADIILDQTYAEDQGYNALEAMAQGKVVFTGAGASFCERYQVAPNSVAIHTIPDAKKIAQDLEELILNPQRIAEIGTRAKRFIQEHHNHLEVAEHYVSAWNSIKNDDAVSASSEAQKSDTKNSKPAE